jgi:FtsH-binding integral membrane protein
MMKSDVFERSGEDTMTRGAFYLAIGIVLAWGFAATYIVSSMTATWQPSIGMFLLVGLAIPILGILLSTSSEPLVSFAGFNLVVIPSAAILGPALQQYEVAHTGIVAECAMLTGAVACVMAMTGLLFPNFYRSIGGMLFGALLTLLVVLIISLFVPALANFGVIQWGAAVLFALYIGFDMWRASDIPATLDNAIDVSVSLYLDIINLFLWILRIRSNDD